MTQESRRKLATSLMCAALLNGSAAAQEPTKITVSGQPFVANLHLPAILSP